MGGSVNIVPTKMYGMPYAFATSKINEVEAEVVLSSASNSNVHKGHQKMVKIYLQLG